MSGSDGGSSIACRTGEGQASTGRGSPRDLGGKSSVTTHIRSGHLDCSTATRVGDDPARLLVAFSIAKIRYDDRH